MLKGFWRRVWGKPSWRGLVRHFRKTSVNHTRAAPAARSAQENRGSGCGSAALGLMLGWFGTLFVGHFFLGPSEAIAGIMGLGIFAGPLSALYLHHSYAGRKVKAWKRAVKAFNRKQEKKAVTATAARVNMAISNDGSHLRVALDRPEYAATKRRPGELSRVGLGIPYEVNIAANSVAGSPQATGDPVFDANLFCSGPAHWLRAMLPANVRTELVDLQSEFGAEVRQGMLVIPLVYTRESNRSWTIRSQLKRFANVARALEVAKADLPGHLLAVVSEDPHGAVAVKAWQALAETYPNAPETASAESRLRASQDRATQLAFGLAMGAEGGEFLEAVLRDESVDDALRVQALIPRLRLLSEEEQMPYVQGVLIAPTVGFFTGCLEAIRRLQIELPVPALEAAFHSLSQNKTADPSAMSEMVVAACKLLVHRHRTFPASEELLLTLLKAFQSHAWLLDPPGPMLAILEALKQVGTTRSVEVLVEIRDRPGRFFAGEWGSLQDALRLESIHSAVPQRAAALVEMIQADLMGAQAGQLSLMVPRDEEGALSLSNQAGEMSLITAEDPETS